MNREDREYIKTLKSILKEAKERAERDSDITTDPHDASYYIGLTDAYSFAYELVRKLK